MKEKETMVVCDHAHVCNEMEREYADCWHSHSHKPSHENEGYGSGLDCDKEHLTCNFLNVKVKCRKV